MVGQQIFQPHKHHCLRCTCHVYKKHQCISKGVVNGATTTITSIIFDSQKLFLKNVHFNTNILNDIYYYKTSFLITLAYGIIGTNHKMQKST